MHIIMYCSMADLGFCEGGEKAVSERFFRGTVTHSHHLACLDESLEDFLHSTR